MRQGAFVFCPECGRDNPLENRYCGMCGASLQNRPAADRDAAREPEPAQPTGSRIAGPSFLGLGESPSDAETGSYLLEDEPRRSRVGLLVLLLALVAVGAVFAYQRNYIELPSWLASRLHRQTPAAPAATGNMAASPAVAPNSSATDASEESPAPMTQSDRPSATSSTATSQGAPTETKSQSSAVPQDATEEDATASPATNTSASPDDAADENADAEAASATPKKPSAARLRATQEAERKKQADDRTLILGENYLYGRGGVTKNCDQALIYLKTAAGAHNAKAMGHLGTMYATGNCVPLDRPTAYRWFTQARQADPANPWLESNRQMVWRQMSATEQDRAARQ